MRFASLFIIILVVLPGCNPCYSDLTYDHYYGQENLAPGQFFKAWNVVYQDFMARPELTAEEKDLNRYKVTFFMTTTKIWIELTPDPQHAGAKDLRYPKLTYWVGRSRYEIHKHPFEKGDES